jgi:hypothetical protein
MKRERCSRSSWPLAPVIPTGAPGESLRLKNFRARSGGIPKVFPSPLPHQGVLTRLPVLPGQRRKGTSDQRAAASLLDLRKMSQGTTGHRDNAWEELPVSVSQGMVRRDPSTPRRRFLMGSRFPWRCGRDDRRKLVFRKDATPPEPGIFGAGLKPGVSNRYGLAQS